MRHACFCKKGPKTPSRKAFRNAFGPGMHLGTISCPEPCTSKHTYGNPRGPLNAGCGGVEHLRKVLPNSDESMCFLWRTADIATYEQMVWPEPQKHCKRHTAQTTDCNQGLILISLNGSVVCAGPLCVEKHREKGQLGHRLSPVMLGCPTVVRGNVFLEAWRGVPRHFLPV